MNSKVFITSAMGPRTCQFNAFQAQEALFPEFQVVSGTVKIKTEQGWEVLFGYQKECVCRRGDIDGHIFLWNPATRRILDFSWLKEWCSQEETPGNIVKRSVCDFPGRVWPVSKTLNMYEGSHRDFRAIGMQYKIDSEERLALNLPLLKMWYHESFRQHAINPDIQIMPKNPRWKPDDW